MKTVLLIAVLLAGIVPAGGFAQIDHGTDSNPSEKRSSQSIQTMDSCSNILPLVEVWEEQEEDTTAFNRSFDTMRWYLTHCYDRPDPARAFGDFNQSFGTSTRMNTLEQRVAIRQWLISIRFLSNVEDWYCRCIAAVAGTYNNDLRASRAILLFLINNPRCSQSSAEFMFDYNSATQSQKATWADTVNDPNHAVWDSTVPSLHDLGLDSLLMDASAGVHSDGTGAQIILNARVTENPFPGSTSVSLSIGREAYVRIEVFDLVGRAVENAGYAGVFETGSREIPLDLSNAAPGAYYVRISTANNETRTIKITKE